MRSLMARLGLASVLVLAIVTGTMAALFVDDFSGMPVGGCLPDGTGIGGWTFVYDGYGCNAFVSVNGNTALMQRPRAAASPSETHAGLVVGPAVGGDLALDVTAATRRQLRTGSAPNAWEVAWVLWHYVDDLHFYYFIAKPNGWELGKEDPAYPGAQRFLATGTTPSFPIGSGYRVRVVQVGGTIQVFVNGLLLATVTDDERPYTSGRIGLYTEDAEAYFDDVSVTTSGVGLVPGGGGGQPKPGKGRKNR